MKRPVSITLAISAVTGIFFLVKDSGVSQLLILGLTLGIFFGTIGLKKKPETEEMRPSRI